MAHVSLIVLAPERPTPTEPTLDRVAAWCASLREAGHRVDLLVVGAEPGDLAAAGEHLPGRDHGRSHDAIDGLRAAGGDYRIVVDADRDYAAADFPRLIEPLVAGRAEVALADGRPSGWRALAALGLRPLSGSSDPFSGLVALTRDAFARADSEFKPVGRRFALEILARARQKPEHVVVGVGHPPWPSSLGLDDLRIVKRIVDDRLGNVSRLLQFCVVGASGMIVDLSCYAFFLWAFGQTSMAGTSLPTWHLGPISVGGAPTDLAAAAAVAIGLALSWNFTLNRALTFSYAKNGSVARQFVTYVLSNSLGIILSYFLRLSLPEKIPFFARHKLAAALVGIVAATGISFSMTRWLVFRPSRQARSRPTDDAPEADAVVSEVA